MKVLSGAYTPDEGAIWLDGKEYARLTPHISAQGGISIIYQELSVVNWLDIRENIFMGRLPMKRMGPASTVDYATMNTRTTELLQKVILGKWMTANVKLLIFDEPTKGIDVGTKSEIYKLMRGLADNGIGVIVVTAFERLSTREVFQSGCDPVEKLACGIREYCGRHLGGVLPVAVSIGFPSTINRACTVVVQTPNIRCIPDYFPVVEKLGQALGVPVFINRDVNNLLLFDLEDLDVTAEECVAGIYYGTGIGNAVLVNGKILLGKNGVAAELGHLPVYGNQRVCMCGNVSCMESVVSGIALERIQAESFPNVPINRLFVQEKGAPEIHAFLEGMAQVAAAEVNLFDPDCIILGGGLLQMEGFPRAALEEAVHRYARKPYPEWNLDIRYSRPNQANGAVGATIYAQKRMANPNYL